MLNPSIFRAYDIRGRYPEEINEEAVEQIAAAYAEFVKPQTMAVGGDVRTHTPPLKNAVMKALSQKGIKVIDIGLGPTELLYFTVGSLKLDGGIQVSASHNPAEYNGLKFVKKGVEALSADNGLPEIKALALDQKALTWRAAEQPGVVEEKNLTDDYLDFLAQTVSLRSLLPLKIVANNNFGLSGPLAKAAVERAGAKIDWIELNFQPDGRFPKGSPNPLLPENRAELAMTVKKTESALGVSWDPDGDRCFFTDENGDFIDGSYIGALLAKHLLSKNPGEKVMIDLRAKWAFEATAQAAGGTPIISKVGHSFIKNQMRSEQALFAAETSGHYYYRDFFDADNGLLTFLYFLELIAEAKQPVSQLVSPLRQKFFVSGELNFRVDDPAATIKVIRAEFPGGNESDLDGLSVDFDNWRYSLRQSNTEPLIRLNVEARDETTGMRQTNRLVEILRYHKPKN